MGFMELLSMSFKRTAFAIGGIILLILACFIALSYILRYITYALWSMTPLIGAAIAIGGLAMLGYAVLVKE